MDGTYLPLSATQVAWASGLMVVNAALSWRLRLRLEKELAIATARTIGQLLLMGLVLDWVFQVNRWYIVLALLAGMTVIAGSTAAKRSRRVFPGIWWNTVISVWASSWIVTAFTVLVILKGMDSWHDPQYVIPLAGMVLGNALNGISLGLNSLTETLITQRDQIEAQLAVGATRHEAGREAIRQAVRNGLIPIINSMMVVGLVSLPGMMTGQLLSGTEPVHAVRYQIVIMFLIATTTACGTIGVVVLSFRRLFNARHQFLFDTIQPRR